MYQLLFYLKGKGMEGEREEERLGRKEGKKNTIVGD